MEEKQSILAAGAGASTKFVFDHGERIERVENVKDLKNYVERIDEMIERKSYRNGEVSAKMKKKSSQQLSHAAIYPDRTAHPRHGSE